jgi:hypothetical protein
VASVPSGSTKLAPFVKTWKPPIAKRALSVLRQAVADKDATGSAGAEVWRWQWQLAALVDASSGATREASDAAQAALDGAPAEYRERIRDLAARLKKPN